MNQKRVEMTDADRVKNQPYDIDVIPAPSHPAKSTRVINTIIAAALVVIAIGIGVFLKWSIADENILVVNNSPFPSRVVPDPTGETGGIVFLSANYCKNEDLKGTLRISYVSKSREVFLPLAPETLPKGCENREVPVVIPKDLPRDTYKIKFRSAYNINPLKQNISTDFESKTFVAGQ